MARMPKYNVLGTNEKLGEPSLPLPHQILEIYLRRLQIH